MSTEKRIDEIKDELKRFMCAKTLFWILGIILSINLTFFGYTIGYVNNIDAKIEKNNAQFLRIETQLSQIQTDLTWIKREVNNK